MKIRFFLLFLLILIGCAPQFDQMAMIETITNDVIVPNHARFVDETAVLLDTAEQFTNTPSDDNLVAMQEAWRGASLAWMGCAPFEFDVVQDARIHNLIDNRPAREAFIEEMIAGEEEIPAEVLETLGSSSKGLSAIEYLIFDDAILEDARRGMFVLGAAELLHQNAVDLQKIWIDDGYAQQFIDADFDGGNVQGSFNMLFNKMSQQIEMITWDRLGMPLGKRTGEIRPDSVEALPSRTSIERINATVTTTYAVYAGGFDDYLTHIGADAVAQDIDTHFIEAQTLLGGIETDLGTAITERDPAIEAAYEELRALGTLLKVDAANHLGVTVVFGDADAD